MAQVKKFQSGGEMKITTPEIDKDLISINVNGKDIKFDRSKLLEDLKSFDSKYKTKTSAFKRKQNEYDADRLSAYNKIVDLISSGDFEGIYYNPNNEYGLKSKSNTEFNKNEMDYLGKLSNVFHTFRSEYDEIKPIENKIEDIKLNEFKPNEVKNNNDDDNNSNLIENNPLAENTNNSPANVNNSEIKPIDQVIEDVANQKTSELTVQQEGKLNAIYNHLQGLTGENNSIQPYAFQDENGLIHKDGVVYNKNGNIFSGKIQTNDGFNYYENGKQINASEIMSLSQKELLNKYPNMYNAINNRSSYVNPQAKAESNFERSFYNASTKLHDSKKKGNELYAEYLQNTTKHQQGGIMKTIPLSQITSTADLIMKNRGNKKILQKLNKMTSPVLEAPKTVNLDIRGDIASREAFYNRANELEDKLKTDLTSDASRNFSMKRQNILDSSNLKLQGDLQYIQSLNASKDRALQNQMQNNQIQAQINNQNISAQNALENQKIQFGAQHDVTRMNNASMYLRDLLAQNKQYANILQNEKMQEKSFDEQENNINFELATRNKINELSQQMDLISKKYGDDINSLRLNPEDYNLYQNYSKQIQDLNYRNQLNQLNAQRRLSKYNIPKIY